MRRGIAAIAGSRIVDVRPVKCAKKPILISPPPAQFRRRAVGTQITDVGRVGKRVVLQLDSGDRIVIEPRMTGLLLLAEPPSREHLRMRITLEGRPDQLLYWDRRGLGLVRLVDPLQFEQLYGLEKLGPDALKLSGDLL